MTPDVVPLAVRAGAPSTLPRLPGDLGLAWRPLQPDDLPALVALTTLVQDVDHAHERSTKHEIGEVFAGSWRDPARDSIGAFATDGTLRAFGWSDCRPVTDGVVGPVISGAVHPDHRRRGAGRALVEWLEARARQQLAALDVALPARIRFFVDDNHPGARALAEACGFTVRRWYTSMRRDLAAAIPDVGPPDGFRLEPYTSERADEVRVTHNEAFVPDHWGSNAYDPEAWALHIPDNPHFRPAWSFVVLEADTDRMVGYLLSGAYEQMWKAHGYREGWTDIIGVRREARGRGVAAAMLTTAMRAYARDGMEYAGLGVDTDNPTGALGLYTRLGYERHLGVMLYAKEI